MSEKDFINLLILAQSRGLPPGTDSQGALKEHLETLMKDPEPMDIQFLS